MPERELPRDAQLIRLKLLQRKQVRSPDREPAQNRHSAEQRELPAKRRAEDRLTVRQNAARDRLRMLPAQTRKLLRRKKPVKRRAVQGAGSADAEDKRYSNIPPEKVRTKREKAARQGYEDMLATGTISKPSRKKSKAEEDTTAIRRPADKTAAKQPAPKPSTKKAEVDEYDDDDEYYDDEPRFRAMRIILGIISTLGFAFFIYRGFVTGLTSTANETGTTSGITYIVVALCLLVAALLYFIMVSRSTVFAFLLPMVFYLGGAVFAFLQRGDDLQLLIAAVAGGVLAVISLILAIASRGGGYEDDDDYDDAFEDDYADDDYDD